MPEIMIYNTLSGTKEKLVPVQEGKIGIYCCGPTTYNFIHVGNGRPLVVFDTIRRFLSYQGFDITFVSNFTDVDDKIISRAAHEGKEARELSGYYIEEYFKDADALNILRADEYPKVSEHMPEIIAFVEDLIQKGMAYPIEGDVYYAIGRFPDYGKLSKRSREDLLDGARVDVDPRKENPGDFALWKTAKPGEPFWESPWGSGRPGWHIECSAMSHKYLGESFDIHGGGADLIFPHHENEIAQSEGRFGRPMATYWVHNGFITINHEKMSKSLGNFFLLREVLELFPGQVIRFFLLSVHYRSPLDFDDEQLTVAQRGLERLKNAARNAAAFIEESKRANSGDAGFDTPDDREAPDEQAAAFLKEVAERKKQFEGAMNDDFNTALAIAALFDLARAMNAFAADSQSADSQPADSQPADNQSADSQLAASQSADVSPQTNTETNTEANTETNTETNTEVNAQANADNGKQAHSAGALKEGLDQLLMLADILGLALLESNASGEENQELSHALKAFLASLGEKPEDGKAVEDYMDALLTLRQEYRKAKNFTGADRIRDDLHALGVVVEDTPQGPRWHKA